MTAREIAIQLKRRLDILKNKGPEWVALIDFLDVLQTKVDAKQDKGDPGDKGDQGDPGPQGDVGPEGPEGPQGESGADGVGIPGPQGPKGDSGPPGKAGNDGRDGLAGPMGKDGKQGSPDTPEQIKAKLERVGFEYKFLKNVPPPQIIRRDLPSIHLFGGQTGGGARLQIDSAGQDIRRIIFTGITPKRISDGVAQIDIPAAASSTIDLMFLIDGGGSAITTGLKGYTEVPFACTITAATLLADQSGSIVVDIFKCTYTQFDASSTHPVAGDKITASAPPTITSTTKSQDTSLSGWTVAVSAGDILAFNVNSVSTVQRVTVSLKATKS